MATVIQLGAKQAQGDDTVASKLADETTKLNNNIATDTKNAGQTAIAEPFDATISGGGSVVASAGNATSNATSTADATASADASATPTAAAPATATSKASKKKASKNN